MWVVRPHRDLGPVARLTGCCPDLDHTGGNLRHLELEEPFDQAWVGSAHHDLWALRGLADLDDVGLEAGTVVVALVGDLLRLRQERLDLAEVEQGVAVVGLLDDAGDDVALSAGVLVVLHVPLDLTDPLHDHLLGGLCGDAAEVLGGVVPLTHDVALDVELLAVDPDLAGVRVDGDDCLLGRVRQPLVGSDERVGESVEERVDGDALVPCDLPECIEELEVSGAHGAMTLSVAVVCCRRAPLDPPAREGDGLEVGPHS